MRSRPTAEAWSRLDAPRRVPPQSREPAARPAHILSPPVLARVWKGPNAFAAVRQTMGATRPDEAAPGSVRHDFGLEVGRNLTHASDGPDTAREENGLWFRSA